MKRDLCLGVVLLILFASPCFGQTSPGAADVAFTITRMAEIYHVQPRTVDRNFSADLYTQMIFALDPDKIYFTAEEIQILDKWKYLLDQQLLNRKIDFLNQLTAIYARKINQTDSILDKLSVTPFNLQIKESFSISEDSSFASNEPQRRIKLYKLVRRNTIESILDMQEADSASSRLKPETLEPGQRKKICHSFKRDLERNRQTKGGLAGYIGNAWCESVASCYDPHTEFFSASKKEDFEGELGEKPMQFGFSLGEGKGATEITRLKPGSPAYRSGLIHEGDQIVALQWDANEVVDVSDGSAEEVNAFISGDHGKDLTLTLKKSDGSTLKVTLQREKAALDDGNSKVRSLMLKGNHRIGFISLPAFYTDWNGDVGGNNGCADDVAKEIIKLKKENIEALILDLRYNGGGSMLEAIALVGIFIDFGPVGMTRDKDGKVLTMKDPNRGAVYDGPVIVLINGFTASASELLAAALQDYHRALILGTPSFGKATAQVVLPLDTLLDEKHLERMKNSENYLKITIDRLYRVNGSSAQETGVLPDIYAPDYSEIRPEREKTLPCALANTTTEANKYFHPYPPLSLEELKNFSRTYTDTSRIFISFNQYLKALVRIQTSRDEMLDFQSMKASRFTLNEDLEKSLGQVRGSKPPFSIEWNQYEKLRMQIDEDLRRSNFQLSQVLDRDAALWLGYEIASRMAK